METLTDAHSLATSLLQFLFSILLSGMQQDAVGRERLILVDFDDVTDFDVLGPFSSRNSTLFLLFSKLAVRKIFPCVSYLFSRFTRLETRVSRKR